MEIGSSSCKQKVFIFFFPCSGTIPLSVPSGGDGPIDQDQGERTEEHDSSNNRQPTNITPAQLEQVRNALMGVQAPGKNQYGKHLDRNINSSRCHRNPRYLNNLV